MPGGKIGNRTTVLISGEKRRSHEVDLKTLCDKKREEKIER